MSTTDAVRPPLAQMSLPLLVEEAKRQLNICNACRYCEGFCAVFPALERRTVLDGGDVSQLANLCHDCRACFDACMYSPPHNFDINIPKTLASVRSADYERYVWPRTVPRLLRGWLGVASGAVLASAVLLVAAVVHVGFAGLITEDGTASPYALVPYPVLLVLVLLPAVFALAVMADAGRRFWRTTESAPVGWRSVTAAAWQAATLRYLRGGGSDCYYPRDDMPSPARRVWHMFVAYGFGLCVVSTVAAGISQDILGDDPPYPWLSVPVISGTVGGVALLVGSVMLIVLKTRGSEITSVADMTVKDYGFLAALTYLSASGLATLFTRTTSAYGIVLLLHLAAILLCFASAPYTKFIHIVYRFLALLRDNAERIAAGDR